jgi:YidC/Oxa1 family membrane protein insertase
MEQGRLFLAIVLSILVFFAWELVFVDQQKPPSRPAPEKKTEEAVVNKGIEIQSPAGLEAFEEIPEKEFRRLAVESPLYFAEVSEKGAALTSFVLKNYRESIDQNAENKQLIPSANTAGTALLRFAEDRPSHPESAVYTTDFPEKTLEIVDTARSLSFFLKTASGLTVEKRYTFFPDTYKVGLTVLVQNMTDQPVENGLILSMANPPPSGKRSFAFEGPFAYADRKLEEFDLKKLDKRRMMTGDIEWAGLEDQYFMSVLIPESSAGATIQIDLDKAGNRLEVLYFTEPRILQPGASARQDFSVFIGPKRMSVLKAAGENLDKAINFGFFDVIAKPCLWLMNMIHDRFIPNYGVAIILLTILFKILFWPLGTKSYKSMAEMKKLQPLMSEIRQKYKDDKKKMNEEIMGLYRTYKVNPMSGCLPMIVQIPVFFAFYKMLYEAIELRHAPFLLWINDLSAPDRLLRFGFSVPLMTPPFGIPVLTLIMGVTMFLQQKLSPPPGDPSQARLMMMMPLIFTVIFINFPSGLVLYWLFNNILSIAQQYYITRKTG